MKGTSQWSKHISLESAGQSENILIKSREQKSYEVSTSGPDSGGGNSDFSLLKLKYKSSMEMV